MNICLIVTDKETQHKLHGHDFGARSEGLGRFTFHHGETKHILTVVPINELSFWPGKLPDCYVSQTDECFSPWILNLGRYLHGSHDWTTTVEVLQRVGLPTNSDLATVCRLIVEGKVVPFEQFEANWLFMRRNYLALLSQANCEAVGCNYQQYRQLLGILRRGLENQHEWDRNHCPPEPLVTVSYFVTRWDYGLPGVGPKSLEIIQKIIEKHGLKLNVK